MWIGVGNNKEDIGSVFLCLRKPETLPLSSLICNILPMLLLTTDISHAFTKTFSHIAVSTRKSFALVKSYITY